MENKKEIKIKKYIILILISIFILIFMSTIFAVLNINKDTVIKGVKISGIDVSGLREEELIEKLSKLNEETKTITLKNNDNETLVTTKDLEITYNIKELANKAFLIGRNSNIFVNNFEIVKSIIFSTDIKINQNYNKEKLDEIINKINENLEGRVKESDYYIEEQNLIIINGKEGVLIDSKKLTDNIEELLKNLNISDTIIEVPIVTVKPEKIDIEKIHNEIYKETQDAYISQDPLTVHPHVNGVDFAISIEETKKLLLEDKEEYIIPLKITIANKTLNDLGKEAFPNELGIYSTKYDVNNIGRSTNINLATEKINGIIIMPGETFSYNQTVGKRTLETGYKEAGAYSGGKIVQEVGGGICQVSSTLYNAVIYANLEIIERHNHYFESSYVDAGRDATVSWGTVDFKFKNNRKYPIKIIATSKNGVEKVSIYGIKEETEYEIIIQSKKISEIERTIKYESDNTLESGKEIITQQGHNGCISEAYKIVRLNGETVSTTLLSKDSYHALDRVVKRGTKENNKSEILTSVDETVIDTTQNKEINEINELINETIEN